MDYVLLGVFDGKVWEMKTGICPLLKYESNDDGMYNQGFRIYDGSTIFADTFTEESAREITYAVNAQRAINWAID